MSEFLRIEKFLGLPNIEIELSPFTILIGQQATGKSIIAKICYFSRGIALELFSAIENNLDKSDFDENLRKKFIGYFPSTCWGDSSFLITFKFGNGKITIKKAAGAGKKVSIQYPPLFIDRLNELREELNLKKNKKLFEPRERRESVHRMRVRLREELSKEFGESVVFNQLFVPAGRSFFANLQSSIFTFLSSNNAMDPFLTEFGSFYESLKGIETRFFSEKQKDSVFGQHMMRLSESVLCGKYIHEKGKDFLSLRDGRKILLGNCSSGQQETLPLSIILSIIPLIGSKYSIYIEEPEAHLFPTAQRSILEMIALAFNQQPGMQAMVTTHSPYILTSLNNLIESGNIFSRNPKPAIRQKVENIIPKNLSLSPRTVGAYRISPTGIESIIDPESGLIDAASIDAASQDIAIKFDELISLQ